MVPQVLHYASPPTPMDKSQNKIMFDASADCATFPTPHNRLAAHHTAVRAPGPAGRQHYGWPLVNQVATGRKVTDRNWPWHARRRDGVTALGALGALGADAAHAQRLEQLGSGGERLPALKRMK